MGNYFYAQCLSISEKSFRLYEGSHNSTACPSGKNIFTEILEKKTRNIFNIRPILRSKHSRFEGRKLSRDIVGQCWWTNGMWNSLMFQLISFLPASLYCEEHVYVHTYPTAYRLHMNYRCYQITLHWNSFTQMGALRCVDWIFIVGVPVWRWLVRISDIGQKVLQPSLQIGSSNSPQFLPNFIPHRIPRGDLYWQ
jgi:hypothetical protein